MTENQQMDAWELLSRYVATGSEEAFHELVTRYVDLVYSAAVRLLDGDTHLAEDVTQTVFADLARMASQLSREVKLGGWLHRHTCFVARNTLRGERRRVARERKAMEMNEMQDHSAANLARIAPALDEAIDELGLEDREAIVLRFFEQRDFRSVGEALGSNEDAARKRVGRALDKLNGSLSRRGVTLTAAALATALSTGAVSAAPAGLAAAVSSAAVAGAVASGGTAITLVKIISMSKIKAGIVTAVLAAGIAIPLVIQHRAQVRLDEVNETLRQQTARNNELTSENQRLAKLPAAKEPVAPRPPDDQYRELMRLRGEIGALRRETAQLRAEAAARTNAPSMLSGLKANPEMWKMIRTQQKAGMSMIYSGLTNRVRLETNQVHELNEMLADFVMDNIDEVTKLIKDGKSVAEMDQVFTAREKAMDAKVKELIGPEGFAEYQDFTRNLASHITAEQFMGTRPGEPAEKEAKKKQLYQLLQEEAKNALTGAGLPSDYQLVPTLNFRNFASEETSERSLQLLDSVYERTSARAGSFLSPEDIEKFGAFRTNAINVNRLGIGMNRKMMSPGSP
jgi:RNA polymerase sigma factor (sigma-70 family)